MELCGHDLDSEPIASRRHPTTFRFKRAISKDVTEMLNEVGAEYELKGFTGKITARGCFFCFHYGWL
jgi:hypothetical protein